MAVPHSVVGGDGRPALRHRRHRRYRRRFARLHDVGIGAEIMRANKFGPPGWQEDPEWKGWWGPSPPFHTPVFVLTHHPRPSIEMEDGATYHFIDTPGFSARKARLGRFIRNP